MISRYVIIMHGNGHMESQICSNRTPLIAGKIYTKLADAKKVLNTFKRDFPGYDYSIYKIGDIVQ